MGALSYNIWLTQLVTATGYHHRLEQLVATTGYRTWLPQLVKQPVNATLYRNRCL